MELLRLSSGQSFFNHLLHRRKKRLIFATVNDGAIAQMVEQRTENPRVPGSIPGGTTKRESYYSNSLFLWS